MASNRTEEPTDIDEPEHAAAREPVHIELPEDTVEAIAADMPDGEVEADVSSTRGGADLSLASVEALLFSTHHPLTPGRLGELLECETTAPVKRAVKALNEQYEATGRAFRIEQVAGGYQMLTLPEHGELVRTLVQKEADAKLGKAALETLAIIAYKQPILRADIEAIRGVACGETVRGLMEKHLVKIAGRAEEPGRPILYGTTRRFLEVFGLNSLKDLPQAQQLAKPSTPLPVRSDESAEETSPPTESA